METAWPAVRDGKELLGWAVEEWAGEGAGAILRLHLERDPELKADDPALLADLAPYEPSAQNQPADEDESDEEDEDQDEDPEDQGDHEPTGLGPFVALWLRLLQAREEHPADRAALTTLGRPDDREAMAQVMDLTAAVAARLQARAGWTRDQAWVLLRELGPLLRDVARRQREAKVDLAGLLLPPASTLLDRLLQRNMGMFASKLQVIAAVTLALPAWAWLMAERGWVSETQRPAKVARARRGRGNLRSCWARPARARGPRGPGAHPSVRSRATIAAQGPHSSSKACCQGSFSRFFSSHCPSSLRSFAPSVLTKAARVSSWRAKLGSLSESAVASLPSLLSLTGGHDGRGSLSRGGHRRGHTATAGSCSDGAGAPAPGAPGRRDE